MDDEEEEEIETNNNNGEKEDWDYEHEMIPAKNGDPLKCSDDFCSWRAVPGTDKCKMHGGINVLHKQNATAIRNYRLGQWNQRVNEFADSPAVKSLRDEIGIARMTLEVIILKCQSPNQIFLHSNKIADMLSRIEKLITSCNRLEDKLGYTIDKASIIMITTQIVKVISLHVNKPTLDQITQEIADVIMDPNVK